MITFDMVRDGYEAGIIKLIESPNGDGVVCGIGDNWFYFGGMTAEEMSVEEYCRDIPKEDFLKDIFQVLEDFRKDGDVFEDEYLYYEAFLSEQLQDLYSPLTAKKAADFVRENPVLAREIFYFMDREYMKEDVLSKIEDMKGVNPGDFSDEEIGKIASRFENGLEHNDSYWESYWLTAETAIEEFMKEKNKAIFSVSMEDCGAIVDAAIRTIRGVGVDMGSGCYDLNTFEFDGEKLNLYVDICKMEDDVEVHYAIYYAVEYVDGDNLFHDWECTSRLDSDELKEVIHKIANTDFSKNIKEELNKGDVEAVICDAKERYGTSVVSDDRMQEYVKD